MTAPVLPLAAALQQLTDALDSLEGAVARRKSHDKADASRAIELELMRGDRAKLAEQLDDAMARAKAHGALLKDVTGRVDTAIAHVEAALSLQPKV